MIIDHRIKLDVEPELKLPAPRSIRRRAGRGFPLKLGHLFLLTFIMIALFLLLALGTSLVEIIVGRKPIQTSFLVMVFYTLFWSCCTGIFVWRIYALPLVNRWLVIKGEATLGHITGFTTGGGGRGGELRVHYEFSPAGRLPIKEKALVGSIKVWKELREGNTVITVMYSRNNPMWNVPYICADYEAVGEPQPRPVGFGPERG